MIEAQATNRTAALQAGLVGVSMNEAELAFRTDLSDFTKNLGATFDDEEMAALNDIANISDD
jgi:hypothetical protein